MNDNLLNGRNLSNMVRVPGSERTIVPGSQKVSPANPDERISVTVVVRCSSSNTELTSMIEEMSISPVKERRHITHEEFLSNHGSNKDDLKKVEEFAKGHNLEVKEVNTSAGNVVLLGTIDDFSKAFGVELATYENPEFTYRGREGYIHIPENLSNIVEAVLGLDNRPQVKPHIRFLEEGEEGFARAHAETGTHSPVEVAQLYNFPSLDCRDQCIGIIELGGGYRSSDLEAYFNDLGVPQPQMIDVSVDGATNQPGVNRDYDAEVALDIEVAAAVAPGAKIAVYFGQNGTTDGFYNAITKAIFDTRNNPSAISISWGNPESEWTPSTMQAMNRAFKDAAALGKTICCSSGDDGASDYRDTNPDQLAHVDFPASSPFVLSCGGTRLEGSGNTITKEVVWNQSSTHRGSTGGGISDVFDLPSWQQNANVPPSVNPGGRIGRGVPDVAGNGDPFTGYQVLIDGQQGSIGGTSAVAPLWAGLIANINHKLGHPVGFINPTLYNLSNQASIFHDITSGNNSYNNVHGYEARSG
jgi:kumamolisin